MKKLLLCMLVAAGFLAGCGETGDMTSEPAEPAAGTAETNNAVEAE